MKIGDYVKLKCICGDKNCRYNNKIAKITKQTKEYFEVETLDGYPEIISNDAIILFAELATKKEVENEKIKFL